MSETPFEQFTNQPSADQTTAKATAVSSSKFSEVSQSADDCQSVSRQSVSQRIRAAISPTHDAIEQVPFARAIGSGRLTIGDYTEAFWQIYWIHHTLEQELPKHDCLRTFDQPAFRRAELLQNDLSVLGAAEPRPPQPACQLMNLIRQWSATQPWSLLGVLYILEGSRMGSMLLAGSLAQAFGCPEVAGVGLDYHLQDVANRPQLWREFKSQCNRVVAQAATEESVLQGACATMEAMYHMYAAFGVQNSPV